ncbi:MAG: GspH/FimT family pseudopilin [Rhodoferax sp.]|jgi:type IV fimbrial biogenesis protein FimT|nr:GspH/FimT family pseudopilin [Rhodoferax sp.]
MNKSRGFTMIELMVVIAIIAILTTIAAPSFKAMLQSNSMTSTVNGFLADTRYARSESIRRGGDVVMCRSDNPETSTPICATGSGTNGWVSGWIIYLDQNGNGTIESTELLRVQGPITSIDSITQTSGSARNELKFTATGRLTLTSMLSLQFGGGSFANEAQRTICLNVGGRARIAGDGYASC